MSITQDPSVVKPLSPAEARRLWQAGGLAIVDVRTEVEHATVHADGVEHLPLDRFDAPAVAQRFAGKPVACICKSGGRAGKAAQLLISAGATEVYNITGGTEAWVAAGLPVVRQARVIPLERQVLIGAGSLVVSGVALAYLVNPWFLLLSLFVGCGLMFAGLTGFCGMAIVLARMPWNRGFAKATCCQLAR